MATKDISSKLNIPNGIKIGKKINPKDSVELSYDDAPGTCTCCGQTYNHKKTNFYKSNSPLFKGVGGYVFICKRCTLAYYNKSVDFFQGVEEKALDRIAQLFDLYCTKEILNSTFNKTNNTKGSTSKVATFIGKIAFNQYVASGHEYLDTLKDRQENERRIHNIEDVKDEDPESWIMGITKPDDEKERFQITKDIVRKWGTGMREDEYDYLEEEYKDWCNKVDVKSKAQEELIKNICLSQLNIRRAQASNNAKSVQEAQKNFTDLLQNCNLTPRQVNEVANVSQAQLSLGNLIKKIENEEPIGEPEDEFCDPDQIRRYVSAFMFGHLAKALKIKNDNQKLYDEEMEKYTVKLPEADSELDDINDLLGDTLDG